MLTTSTDVAGRHQIERAVAPTLTRRQRMAFVLGYIAHKTVLLPWEVRSPRMRLLAYEIVYSVCRLLGRNPLPLRFLKIHRVDSVLGTFHVRPGTIDAACASPAFERPDVDVLLEELDHAVAAGRDIVFVDVGADIGTYSVTVGNHLRSAPRAVRIVAFEPSTSSVALLRRNIEANDLDAATVVRDVALGDGSHTSATLTFDREEPGCSGLDASALRVREGHVVLEQVVVSTLDDELAGLPELDLLVLKLDVEGFEKAVLEGSRVSVARAAETLLLVEDFVDRRIVDHLYAEGWTVVRKVTPYNSFWRHTRSAGGPTRRDDRGADGPAPDTDR